jgi:hypothetical protein
VDELELETVLTAANRLLDESRENMIEGEDLARELGIPADDPDARLYYALRELERRGDIDCMGWHGGMGLPYGVRRAY